MAAIIEKHDALATTLASCKEEHAATVQGLKQKEREAEEQITCVLYSTAQYSKLCTCCDAI
jgi:hypothetical protein